MSRTGLLHGVPTRLDRRVRGADPCRHDFLLAFKLLMLLCSAAIVVFAALTLRRLRADTSRRIVALGVLALAPLLLGPVLTTHYDPWPAALTGAALALLLGGRDQAALGRSA